MEAKRERAKSETPSLQDGAPKTSILDSLLASHPFANAIWLRVLVHRAAHRDATRSFRQREEWDVSTPVENLVEGLHAKRSGKGWIAKCPAHNDLKPSLSINEGADGRALIKCQAGCSTEDVLTALGITYRDLFPAKFSEIPSTPERGNQLRPATSRAPDIFLSKQECLCAIEMALTLREAPNLCERIGRVRGWKPETIRELSREPSLGWHDGKLAFIYETGVKFRWRQGGERIIRWAFGNPWLWRGSYIDIATTVYLCEGETDAISLIDAGLESDERTIAVALPFGHYI
jgi:hypothetical protein